MSSYIQYFSPNRFYLPSPSPLDIRLVRLPQKGKEAWLGNDIWRSRQEPVALIKRSAFSTLMPLVENA